MSLDPELVRQAIERNDAVGVRALLRDATESDRGACAKALRPLLAGPDFSELGRIPFPGQEPFYVEGPAGLLSAIIQHLTGDRQGKEDSADRVRDGWNAMRNSPAFLAASLGLAGGPAAAHIAADRCDHWQQPGDRGFDAIAGVLADRRPPWLAELVSRKLCARFELGLCSWTLARKLVKLGAIDRPDVPQYTTKMPAALRPRRGFRGDMPDRPAILPLLDALLADPDLLKDEVWRLFTVPDAAAWLDGSWEDALMTLSERGLLDRGRLLDACLDAFTMDFAPNRVGWYVTFHDRMDPSPGEMAARHDRYLRLLAADSRGGVSRGQKACGRLLEAGLLDPEDFLAACGPALLFPGKTVATAQLKLIGKVAAAEPSARGRALAAAAVAFGHQRVDVQEAALKLIARYGLPEGDERLVICGLAASLAPALAREAAALGLPIRPAAQLIEIPDQPRSEPSAGDKLPPPLDDPGELIQLLTRLMEDASDALAVERAVAGAVRLCALPAAERARLAAPLLKRAEKRLREDYDGPFAGREISCDIAGLTLAWGAGWMPRIDGARRRWGAGGREAVLRSGAARTMAGILTARIWEASALIAAGRSAELLAEPDSERGAIGPDRLLARLGSWTDGSAPRHDLEIALLRLMPGMDDSFWSAWARVHPSSVRSARRAYQQGLASLGFEPQIGRPGNYRWLTGPIGSDAVVVARLTTKPADSQGSRCWALLTALSRPLDDFCADYGQRWQVTSRYQAVVAGWPLLCPWQPELAAAHLLRPLSNSLQPGTTWVGSAATAARGLSCAGQMLGEVGHLALLTGLASAEPYVRIASAEVWATASRDGRLDPALASAALVTGVTGGAFKLNRIADGLQHASHEPTAGHRIVQTIFAAADGLIPARPANLHLMFELAAGIGAVTGTPPPTAAIIRVAAEKNGSKLAAAARRLVPLP
jgi:hypothetical protein